MEDLILDFNLYLCEKFGYRNSCSVHPYTLCWLQIVLSVFHLMPLS